METTSTVVENVPLELVDEPQRAYVVEERNFAVATYSPEFPYMVTSGLWICKGVTFYKPQEQKGLLSHLGRVEKSRLKPTISRLVAAFNQTLTGAEVQITVGAKQWDNKDFYGQWPTWEEIALEIAEYHPDRILIHDEFRQPFRNIALDLRTGQVQEFVYVYKSDDNYLNRNLSLNQII